MRVCKVRDTYGIRYELSGGHRCRVVLSTVVFSTHSLDSRGVRIINIHLRNVGLWSLDFVTCRFIRRRFRGDRHEDTQGARHLRHPQRALGRRLRWHILPAAVVYSQQYQLEGCRGAKLLLLDLFDSLFIYMTLRKQHCMSEFMDDFQFPACREILQITV